MRYAILIRYLLGEEFNDPSATSLEIVVAYLVKAGSYAKLVSVHPIYSKSLNLDLFNRYEVSKVFSNLFHR